ncbi:MAG: M3 family metallopeptidase [Cyclobacteriaceae bacterium]
MSNPFLNSYTTPFEVPPFHEIKNEHYLPALEEGIARAKKEIDLITDNEDNPTFANTIEALEKGGELLGNVASVLFNLNSAETSDDLQAITRDASPMLSAFDNEVKQNEKLWKRIKTVYQNAKSTGEEAMLLEKTYKGFVRSGADLQGESKERFKEISMELSKLTLQFGENLLAETNKYELVIDDEADLKGLPEGVKDQASDTAKQNGKEGKWVFTLQAPSYIPFMEHAENRVLREQLYKAYMSKCLKGDEYDNQDLLKQIVSLRAEIARLLGYETYAKYVLEERMAQEPTQVFAFLEDLMQRALPKAKEEVEEIKEFMKELGASHHLERWDWAYYSEKLRKKKYDLDDELTKPYFKLENVIQGVFTTSEKLYDISFKRNNDLPTYHKEVEAYEVIDSNGDIKAIFYADFFPRKGKRGGAWMTSFREQRKMDGKTTIPIVSIVCNFTPSTSKTPSLLKFEEVNTLFHEFGHALHGMLADTKYASLSGTSVFWDFVELPSQILENWCYEKECLDLFARHYETNELIPQRYIDAIKASATYHEAYATVRQISLALLDMTWHHATATEIEKMEDVVTIEKQAFEKVDLFPNVENTSMSVQFGHIFAGGYAAGYYSYKWAEVLDADAFALFQEKGVFDKEVALAFKDNVLSKGGTEHPMDLYVKFRGKEPSPEALLIRAGLS